MKKKTVIPIIVVLVVLIAVGGWYFGYKIPHDRELARQAEELRQQKITEYQEAYSEYAVAVQNYNTEVDQYNITVESYNGAVEEFSAFLKSIDDSNILHEDAYDIETINNLLKAKSDAEASLPSAYTLKEPYTVEEAKQFVLEDTSDIISSAASELSEKSKVIAEDTSKLSSESSSISIPDFSSDIESIQEKWNIASDSVKIQKQITNPAEAFVISRLFQIEEITEIEAATEDNDPNGNLNKAGGYTAAIYFRSSNVDTSRLLHPDNLIEEGTTSGGQVEVYATKEDAEKRNAYLAGFDGTILSSGSHTVLGTMVIRTSDYLTASQQKALEAAIIAALIETE